MDVPGNAVLTVAAPAPPSKLFSVTASCRTLLAVWISVSPLSIVRIWFSAFFFASAALSGQAVRPSAVRSKPGIRLADCTTLPAQNSALPAIEIDAGKREAMFSGCIWSTTRPPQPVPPDPAALPVCICWIWSLCENRLLGSFADPPRTCARVVGRASMPTLAITASLPCAHSGVTLFSPLLKP